MLTISRRITFELLHIAKGHNNPATPMAAMNIHSKVVATAPSAPLFHSLEHRIAALNDRFAALERALATRDAHVPPKAAVPAAVSNPQWEPNARDTAEVARVRAITKEMRLASTAFAWVPSEYYERPLAWRRQQLQAASERHLCKAIVLENTHCVNDDCRDPRNSRYYVAVFQYVQRFDAEKVMRFVKGMNETIGKKNFNFRLAANGADVTGFTHNAVVPFGLKTSMPVILSREITQLNPPYFWMGGGHVDCKLRVDVPEFLDRFQPFVADITVPYSAEELATL
jgi:prolyl-tRNA editing enzyme YbaK/EbsC (Cys-tRNA(Pro) deacylase)